METKRIPFEDISQNIPLHEFVTVEKMGHSSGEKILPSGIIIPEVAMDTLDKQYWAQGKVLSVPKTVKELSFKKDGIELKAGHIVLFSTGHGVTFTLDDQPKRDFRMVDYENIYSILNPVVPEKANCEEEE